MELRLVLHVEVLINSRPGAFVRTDLICNEVKKWLPLRFLKLKVSDVVKPDRYLDCKDIVESVKIVDCTGPQQESSYFRLSDAHLDVQVYELCEKSYDNVSCDDQEVESARTLALPNKCLEQTFETLVFDTSLPRQLLGTLTSMMSDSGIRGLGLVDFSWNRLLLLYGPPGTGKTTLCRALAQKLTIRLGKQYTQSKLVEIRSHALLSKYFGESSQLVAKLFEEIEAIAVNEDTLICVLIDEVESLTGSRERAVTGSECSDALRATNQLLTGLDRLRPHSNVVIFCTSNLPTAIDSAFMDRVDITEFVPPPSPTAIYEILRSCLNQLLQHEKISTWDQCEGDVPGPAKPAQFQFPTYTVLKLDHMARPDSVPNKLWEISQYCEGLSGRTLRKLPFIAIVPQAMYRPCTMEQALSALSIEAKKAVTARSMQATNWFQYASYA